MKTEMFILKGFLKLCLGTCRRRGRADVLRNANCEYGERIAAVMLSLRGCSCSLYCCSKIKHTFSLFTLKNRAEIFFMHSFMSDIGADLLQQIVSLAVPLLTPITYTTCALAAAQDFCLVPWGKGAWFLVWEAQPQLGPGSRQHPQPHSFLLPM